MSTRLSVVSFEPFQAVRDLGAELKLHFHNGVYSLVVVIWLMIVQRLHPKGTLLAVVQEAVRQLPPGLVRRPCKRLREGSLSSHTGAYNQARRKLPREVVERVSDRIFEQLMAGAPEARPGLGRRLFPLDGSTLLMPSTPVICSRYFSINCCMAFSRVVEIGFSTTPVYKGERHYPFIASFAAKPRCATTSHSLKAVLLNLCFFARRDDFALRPRLSREVGQVSQAAVNPGGHACVPG